MKALSICQPHAHAILAGEQIGEGRMWPTKLRGPVLIHAGKDKSWLEDEERATLRCGHCGAEMALGAIVGQAELVSCVQEGSRSYRFMFKRLATFEQPIPWKGALGFFDVPDEVIGGARIARLIEESPVPPEAA